MYNKINVTYKQMGQLLELTRKNNPVKCFVDMTIGNLQLIAYGDEAGTAMREIFGDEVYEAGIIDNRGSAWWEVYCRPDCNFKLSVYITCRGE